MFTQSTLTAKKSSRANPGGPFGADLSKNNPWPLLMSHALSSWFFSRIFPSIMKGTAGMEIKCGSSGAVVGVFFVSDSSSNNLRLGISCVVRRTGENKLGGELRLSTDERALRRKNQQCAQIRSAILIAERNFGSQEAKRNKQCARSAKCVWVAGRGRQTTSSRGNRDAALHKHTHQLRVERRGVAHKSSLDGRAPAEWVK